MTDPSAADRRIIRDLAKRYADIAAKPIQDERRALWRRHNSRHPTRAPVLVRYGMWNVWCREVFGDHTLECEDPFFRAHERQLRLELFHDTIGDDHVCEPWITQRAAVQGSWGTLWGIEEGRIAADIEGGAWQFDPPLRTWADAARLVTPRHVVDEDATARHVARLRDAVGDIIEVAVDRSPAFQGFSADISTHLTRLRGLEQLMIDMIESPRELHAVLAFMRDGILGVQDAAEKAGDWRLLNQHNQEVPYCEELAPPQANSGPCRRRDLWVFSAAQEFTLISPAMHEEFLLRYQIPIIAKFGLAAYGCCEDLTRKIDMLRQIPNLRVIAVTPVANVARCAEQIGLDYVMSWRPNPTDMVCAQFDEARIRRLVRHALDAAHANGGVLHIYLKDVETVQGEPDRLARWARLVRDEAEQA